MRLIKKFLLFALVSSNIILLDSQPQNAFLASNNQSIKKKIMLSTMSQKVDESKEIIDLESNLKGFEYVIEFLETFIVRNDKTFSWLIDTQSRTHYYYYYVKDKIVKDIPNLSKELETFFSRQNGCNWFYVFKKDLPYEGFFFYKVPDSKKVSGDILWLAKFNAFDFMEEQWFRLLVEGNIFASCGYIWDKESNVIVRPKQLQKTFTGECVYLFGFSTPPTTNKPIFWGPIPGEESSEITESSNQKNNK